MKALLQTLAAGPERWDAVAWVGAGRATELEAVRALGAGRIVYVEPHEALARRLRDRLDDPARESVQGRPLWTADGTTTFHVANDAISSTLLSPERAWAGRPNLKVVAESILDAQGLETLWGSMALEPANSALLILDIGSAADEVVCGSSDDELARFSSVLLPASCTRAADSLRERGYAADPRMGEDEPGWLLLSLGGARDVDKLEQERLEHADRERLLEAELGAARDDLAQKVSELASLADALERVRAEHASLREQKDELEAQLAAERERTSAELTSVLKRRDELAAEIAGERERALEQVASMRREQQALAAEAGALRQRLEDQADAGDELAERNDALAKQVVALQQERTAFGNEAAQTIAALTAERDTAIGSLVEKTTALERVTADRDAAATERDAASARIGELQRDLVEARRAAALSIKLQAQRDADFSDLQQRYRESREVQERQRELLERLGERLGTASRYFHQIAEQRQAAATMMHDEPPPRPPAGRARKTPRRKAAKPTET